MPGGITKRAKWTLSFKQDFLLNQWKNINQTKPNFPVVVHFEIVQRCNALLQMSFTFDQISTFISRSICYLTIIGPLVFNCLPSDSTTYFVSQKRDQHCLLSTFIFNEINISSLKIPFLNTFLREYIYLPHSYI